MGGERLPVFVYGTLRPGRYNHRVVAGALAAASPAVLTGHALYVRGLPYVVPQPDAVVVGDLLDLTSQRYTRTLRALDQLEGYREEDPDGSHYVRTRVTVRVDADGGVRPAWVYLAGPRTTAAMSRRGRQVASGDFTEVADAA